MRLPNLKTSRHNTYSRSNGLSTASKPKKKRNYAESKEGEALIKWARLHPILRPRLFHIPNGGGRSPIEGARLKREGVMSGVSDYFLPYPNGLYAGLWIELKPIGGRKPSPEQSSWLAARINDGYAGVVAYGWIHAKELIEAYLQGEEFC